MARSKKNQLLWNKAIDDLVSWQKKTTVKNKYTELASIVWNVIVEFKTSNANKAKYKEAIMKHLSE